MRFVPLRSRAKSLVNQPTGRVLLSNQIKSVLGVSRVFGPEVIENIVCILCNFLGRWQKGHLLRHRIYDQDIYLIKGAATSPPVAQHQSKDAHLSRVEIFRDFGHKVFDIVLSLLCTAAALMLTYVLQLPFETIVYEVRCTVR